MTELKKLTKLLLPESLRRLLFVRERRIVFRRAMLSLLRDPHCLDDRDDIISDLSYCWGNKLWSASDEYVLACAKHALHCKKPILECGSGLTTLVLGAIAQNMDLTVWTLEHNERWAKRIKNYLCLYRIRSVNILLNPLRDYGAYSWYDLPMEKLPDAFDLVVCDGPPYDTPGGRYGLLPVMRDRLPAGTTILLDDAGRVTEQNVADRWAEALGTTTTILGIKNRRRYVRITIPESIRKVNPAGPND